MIGTAPKIVQTEEGATYDKICPPQVEAVGMIADGTAHKIVQTEEGATYDKICPPRWKLLV